MTVKIRWTLVIAFIASLAATEGAAQEGWERAYKVGDPVQLKVTDFIWQDCTVSENTPGFVMRVMCEEYVEPPPGTYTRAGGRYIVYGESDLRRPTEEKADEGWMGEYALGDAVQLKINDAIWQDCTVSEKGDGMLRVMCEEYVEPPPGTYTRAGGRYIVYGESDLRRPGSAPAPPATGGPSASSGPAGEKPAARMPAGSPPPPVVSKPTGPEPTGVAPKAAPKAAPKGAGGGLRVGEYACYGSGGQILAGFGFKALGNGRYTDLEGGNAGSYSVNGDTVTFRGGHLDGTVGRALNAGNFRIGAQATCEPF